VFTTKRRQGIKQRVIVPVMAAIIFLFGLGSIITLSLYRHSEISQKKQEIEDLASLQSDMLIEPVWQLDLDILPTLIEKIQKTEGFSYIAVMEPNSTKTFVVSGQPAIAKNGNLVRIEREMTKNNEKIGTLVIEFDIQYLNDAIQRLFIFVLFGMVVFMSTIALIINQILNHTTRPIVEVTHIMGLLSAGQLEIVLPQSKNNDEVGDMIQSLAIFKENAVQQKRLEQESAFASEKSRREKKLFIENISTKFESNVQKIIENIATASTQLFQNTEFVNTIVSNTQSKADSVSMASSNTSDNVQGVASAAEEMTATAMEIARQIDRVNHAIAIAVQQVGKADETSTLLDSATLKIEKIVDLIKDIADQINLLALNATIEAARAGDAGKGFAVVAGEVKGLANQTSKATDEIASNIRNIQGISQKVIFALDEIKKAVSSVDAISSAITAAAEEQTATTQDIVTSMNSAAHGTQQISRDISAVSHSSNEASHAAGQAAAAAKELTEEIDRLHHVVGAFLMEMRQS
jgi:methyl-accepting chemotaxis protein